MSDRRETWLVGMAKAGHQRAVEELAERYWPLVYNIVGHGLGGGAELERVLRRTIEQIEREVPDVPEPRLVRGWAAGTALRQVRQVRRPGRSTAGGRSGPVGEPDFASVTIEQLKLSGPARQLVEATRWLSPYDRDVLPLWWLAQVGELSEGELATALDLPAEEAAERIQRMRERLETAREVVAALAAKPGCPDLTTLAGASAHRPAPYRRNQLARHIRECDRCAGHRITLAPADQLLAGVGLVPPPDLTAYRASWAPSGSGTTRSGPAALAAASGSAAARPGWSAGPGWSAQTAWSAETTAGPDASGLAAFGLASRVPAGWEAPGAVGPEAVGPSGMGHAPAGSPPARTSGLPGGPSTEPPTPAGLSLSTEPPTPAGLSLSDRSSLSDGSGTVPPGRRFRPGNLPLRQRILLGLVVSALGAVAIIALLPTQRPAPPPVGLPGPPPPVLDSGGSTAPAAATSTASSAASATPSVTSHRPKPSATARRPAAPPPAEPFHVAYEAEAARRHGDAEVVSLRAASGGRIVQRLGTEPDRSYDGWHRWLSGPRGHHAYRRSGAIEFAASVPENGRYELAIFYVSGERRDGYLRINDAPPHRMTFSGQGGWDTVQSTRVTVELRAGANSIFFGNPWAWAPRLDRITLAE